jgi:poly(A) polymerase
VSPQAIEVTLSDAAWLQQGTLAELLRILSANGEEARVIGGAVRNTLLGLPRGDIDIATTCVPNEVIRRAIEAGFKPVPTGIEHGTVTVIANARTFEVTTLREDVKTYGRKAAVRFGRDWRRDAERRDFTLNALSASSHGTVYDYVGGLDDLKTRRVRFIGDASQRIREDYLRILRFFRFHAAYGEGGPDEDALVACIRERSGLEQLSRERVRAELMKLLVAKRAAATLEVMADSGILLQVLGGVPIVPAFARMADIEAALQRAEDPVLRLGAIAVLVAEDAVRLTERLRLTNVERDRLLSAANVWFRVEECIREPHMLRALLYRLGETSYRDALLLAWVRFGAAVESNDWASAFALPDRWRPPAFPIRAADFIERGIARGPRLGAALSDAEAAWVAAGFPEDEHSRAELIERCAQRYRPESLPDSPSPTAWE